MRPLQVLCCTVLLLTIVLIGAWPGPSAASVGDAPPWRLIDLTYIPAFHPDPPPARHPGGLSLPLRLVAPQSMITYAGLGATVVTPTARLPLAASGFTPGATITATDTGTLIATGTVDAGGFFSTVFTAAASGYHALQVEDSTGRSAVAAYTVAPGGAGGPLLAMAPAWAEPGSTLLAVWAGFPASTTAQWMLDGTLQGVIATGTGEGSFTTTAPSNTAAYIYTLRITTDAVPSQMVQVNYAAPAYGSGTTPGAPSNLPGAWGAVGEGFAPGETVRLTVNGSQVGTVTADTTGVILAAFAAHAVGDNTLEKLTMTGQSSSRRAYAASYFYGTLAAPPGQVQGRWESTTGSTQLVVADSAGLAPTGYQALLDGRLVFTGTTTGNGLAVYSYTVPLRDQLSHNLSTVLDSGPVAASRGTILPCTLVFADVPSTQPFYPYIRWLACYGYINGYACGGVGEPCDPSSDPYFRPGATITRGQLMKMVVNAARWALATPPSPTFADVPTSQPFFAFVETGVSHGLISGYDCGGPGEPCDPQGRPYFRPGTAITRGQLSKVIALARAYALGYPPAPTFADVPTTQPFYLYIEALARNGVISGYACGGDGEPCDPQQRPYFRPANTATRGQVAKFVSVAYGGP